MRAITEDKESFEDNLLDILVEMSEKLDLILEALEA